MQELLQHLEGCHRHGHIRILNLTTNNYLNSGIQQFDVLLNHLILGVR